MMNPKTVWNYIPGVFRETFDSPFEQYEDRIGQRFTVIGKVDVTPNDPGSQELYRIRFADGAEIEAWPEEVCVEDPKPEVRHD